MHATGADEVTASAVLEQCRHHVKTAIVAIRMNVWVEEARRRLDESGGSVRAALGE